MGPKKPHHSIAALMSSKSDSELIQYFIDIIEAKDLYTQGHSHHVHVIVKAILDSLPGEYLSQLNPERLLTAALLHDIGKILTPDIVLNKEGSLTDDEWQIMRQHPQDGKTILEETRFSDMCSWILYHHERLDGRGYYSLAGTDISLESRIISIADTFSALRTYRVYRPAKSISATIGIMREAAGPQLDPDILGHFFSADIAVLENLECNCEICRQRREALEAGGWAGNP